MGSSSIVNPIGHNFLGLAPVARPLADVATGGLAEFTQKNPFGLPINNPLYNAPSGSPGISGPFAMNPTADENAITGLGQKQYNQSLQAIGQYKDAAQTYAGDTLQKMIPGLAENAQAKGVLTSSAFPQEVARQASYLSQNLGQDVASRNLAALQGLQGTQSAALQRGFSLEDFTNQANVAKAIGAQMAPQPPTGKQQFATTAQGVGALAPMAALAMK